MDLSGSIIQHMEQEWYAVMKDRDYVLTGGITIFCRVCPFSIHFNDNDMEQVEKAGAAFIAHAKKNHKNLLKQTTNTEHGKTLIADKEA